LIMRFSCCSPDSATFSDDESGPSKVAPKKPAKAKAAVKTVDPTTSTTPSASSTVAPIPSAPVKKPQTAALTPTPSFEPYNPSRVQALFKTYADDDEPDVIGPEGFGTLCMDAQIGMEGAQGLILAWMLEAKEMGKFTKSEWVTGLEDLKISSLPQLALAVSDLESLLVAANPSNGGTTKKKPDPYNKTKYNGYAADPKAAFLKLYLFCFALAKPESARNIDMETATAFWSVLLVPQYIITADIIEFITEKGTYKGANKDLWGMMLEFVQTVKPSLEDYEADGAWPTLLDDFVTWKKAKLDA